MQEMIARMPTGEMREKAEVDLQAYEMYPSFRRKADPERALVQMQKIGAGLSDEGYPMNPYQGTQAAEMLQALGVGEERQKPRAVKDLGIDERLQLYEIIRRAAKTPQGTEENLRALARNMGVDLDSLTEKDYQEIFGD